jgi:DHA1 family bicyclomycin/chloramphenicol resistance-like MFS transporter
VIVLSLVATHMPETLAERDPSRFRPLRLLGGYAVVASDLRFLRPAIVIGGTIGILYASATMLPFVLIDRVGMAPVAFGMGMLAQSGSYILGSIATRFLMQRFRAERLVPYGIGLVVLGALLIAILLRIAAPSYLSVMGPIALIAFGIALVQPAATTEALAPFPGIAGSAAALLGFAQIGGGFAGSFAAALLHEPVRALATVVPAMALIALAAYYGLGAINARNARSLVNEPTDTLAPGE